MKRFEWSPEFSVGHRTLDAQHARIMGLIDKLARAGGGPSEAEIVSDTLDEMMKYSRSHFTAEERILLEVGFPDYERHVELHRAYVKKVVAFCQATTMGVDSVPAKLLEYLKVWFTHHILQEDMKYKSLVTSAGTGGVTQEAP